MIWLLLALLVGSGVCRAFKDALSHDASCLAHWGTWWDASTSWKLKYQDGDETKGAAFPGSRTWLVFLSDAWHMAGFLERALEDAAILVVGWGILHWWVLVPIAARRVVFQPVYSLIRK